MMVEDRGSLGLTELQRITAEVVQAGNSQPTLRGLAVGLTQVRHPPPICDVAPPGPVRRAHQHAPEFAYHGVSAKAFR